MEAIMKNVLLSFGRKAVLFSAISFMLLTFSGCDKLNFLSPKKEEPKQVVAPVVTVKGTIIAKVNNTPITLEELNEEVDAYNAMVPQDKPELKVTTREQKMNYLKNDMIRRALLYQDAQDRGLDKSEDVQKSLDKIKQNLLVSQLVRQEADKVDVSSKEVEDYYNTYKEQLKSPEERNIREIAVSTEAEAKDIMIQLLQGADFATLAKERSKSASANAGGDLGFIQKGKKSAQFDSMAFSDSLEAGKTSNIFKGQDGYYYILKLEAKKGGQQKPLADMWDDIKRGLIFLKQQQKIEDMVGKLSSSAKIEVYEGEIK
jgi:parvulin-like peptidyl-prolyl isomerase